jgi:hypothetical protein
MLKHRLGIIARLAEEEGGLEALFRMSLQENCRAPSPVNFFDLMDAPMLSLFHKWQFQRQVILTWPTAVKSFTLTVSFYY